MVTPEVAQQIAKDDPSLVYIRVQACGWVTPERRLPNLEGYNADNYFTPTGMYLGPDDDGIEPRWEDAP